MATAVLKDLRAHFPEAKITALCQTTVASLIEEDPHLSEILSYKKPSGWIHRAEHRDVIMPLRMGEFDLGLLLTNSFTSAWWFWRGNVQKRIGFAGNFRSWLLTEAVPKPSKSAEEHLVTTYKKLLKPLGIPISNSKPALYLTAEDRFRAEDFLKLQRIEKNQILIGINPGAAYGSAKCWPSQNFIELTFKLLERPNTAILFFGDASGASEVNKICENMPARVLNLAGKTSLRELMALIEKCSLFLSNDSGPMHMASALGTPLIALFGSTSEIRTGPYNGGLVIHKHVDCSPCYKRVCPIDFRCMTKITPEEVYQQIEKMIPL